jgi:hypothetical protein
MAIWRKVLKGYEKKYNKDIIGLVYELPEEEVDQSLYKKKPYWGFELFLLDFGTLRQINAWSSAKIAMRECNTAVKILRKGKD